MKSSTKQAARRSPTKADKPASSRSVVAPLPTSALFGRAFPAWADWAVSLGLAILTSLNTLANGFASDDQQQVLNNLFIKDLSNLPKAFTTSVWSFVSSDIAMTAPPYYRPLFSVLFTFTYAVFGEQAWGWHLVNLIIHALVTVLVYFVLSEMTESSLLAVLASTLFAVHPAHAESVAWISGVTDPLMCLFLLPSLYAYLQYKKRGRRHWLALMLVAYLCALMSKETALALPLFILYAEVSYFREVAALRRRLGGAVALAGWLAIPTALYFALRYQALGSLLLSDKLRYPLSAALATMPLALLKYLTLLSLPYGYSYQHLTPLVESFASLRFLAPLATLIALGLAVFFLRSRDLQFAAAWFILPLAPALAGIRHFDPEYAVQERYLYLSSAGFCLAVALGMRWLWQRESAVWHKAAGGMVAILIVVWSVAYIRHNAAWDDTISIFERCVAVEPQSAIAHAALGSVYFQSGRPKDADNAQRTALALDPTCAIAYQHLSYAAHQSGRLNEAIDYLEQGIAAIHDDPNKRNTLATLQLNLGLLYGQQKQTARAEELLLASTRTWSRALGFYYAAQFYFDQGRYEEALAMYQEVLRRVPENFALIHFKLAQTYERLNQTEQMRAAYTKYLELAPPNANERREAQRRLQSGDAPATR